jgi:agmatinase
VSVLRHSGNAFLDLPPELADPSTSRVFVLPIPYEATTSYVQGTRRGPAALIEASSQVEFYDEIHEDEPCRSGIHTLPPLDCRGTPGDVLDRIREEASRHIGGNRFVLSLGGEHTLTVGCVEGAADALGPLTVVQIDAHADLRDEYGGSSLSHACVMRRLADKHAMVQIGIRALSEEEARFTEARKIPVVGAAEIAEERSRPGASRTWMTRAIDAIGTDLVYLTFDLDGMDPSIVPAVGTPEPGGLLWHETLAFIDALFAARTVVAADVVELCPVPGSVASDFAAARIAYKIAGAHLRAAQR